MYSLYKADNLFVKEPILNLCSSISTTGIIPEKVPVTNASSALYTSSIKKSFSNTLI